MPISWFFVPMGQRPAPYGPPTRYCTMDDYTAAINADGGAWAESEVLGGQAVVKVNASNTTLTTIAADARFTRFPASLRLLDDPLSGLSAAQRNAIRTKVLSLGYTADEVNARFPNLANATLGDVLRFACKRRLKARWDAQAGQIVLDGDAQVCTTPEAVDAEV